MAKEKKSELDAAFLGIKEMFESLPQYKDFVEAVRTTVSKSVKGFTHSLEVDFSAYDPNNYANALRIVAAENGETRSFEEFGTGEQQILLMAFAKAFLQVFGKNKGLVLIIEEPEAHLHPLAQKWLKQYIYKICSEGVQVIISTHSPDFLDPRNLEGLARVSKESGTTVVHQVTAEDLVSFCISTGAPENKVSVVGIRDFYAAKVTPSQLNGLFAEQVILVEGPTELLALPVYFEKLGYHLAAQGTDIVVCDSKNSIPLLWRLYEAFGYKCFCLFDADESQDDYDKAFEPLFGSRSIVVDKGCFTTDKGFAYFGGNWEEYFEATMPDYLLKKKDLCERMNIDPRCKQAVAYAYATEIDDMPAFVPELLEAFFSFES